MNKAVLSLGAIALFGIGLSVPASGQMMCGPGQQAQGSPTGGMMCGAMGATEPKAEGETQKPQRSGMCPCCRNMAMMRGGGSMQQHHMPGMPGTDAPKQ